jgi:hypothetical protein
MSNFIEETDVTLARLSLLLENAAISHETQQDNALYIDGDLPYRFWVRLSKRSRHVTLSSYIRFQDGITEEQKTMLCARANTELSSICAYPMENRLCTDFSMSYSDGLIPTQFLRLCRSFAGSTRAIEDDMDPERALIVPMFSQE